MPANTPSPLYPPPGTPPAAPNLADMDQIHKNAFGGTLATALQKLAKKAK